MAQTGRCCRAGEQVSPLSAEADEAMSSDPNEVAATVRASARGRAERMGTSVTASHDAGVKLHPAPNTPGRPA